MQISGSRVREYLTIICLFVSAKYPSFFSFFFFGGGMLAEKAKHTKSKGPPATTVGGNGRREEGRKSPMNGKALIQGEGDRSKTNTPLPQLVKGRGARAWGLGNPPRPGPAGPGCCCCSTIALLTQQSLLYRGRGLLM